MNLQRILTITSLLSIVLVTFHLADDIVRGMEGTGFTIARGALTQAIWLYGTVALVGRRSGYIIMLLGSLLGMLVHMAHMRGAGILGGGVAGSNGAFFWAWTIVALGVTASVSVVLSVQGLWSLRRRGPIRVHSS